MMDAGRRLIVDLQNLASKARDAAALDELEATKHALDAAKIKATVAILAAAQAAAARPAAAMSRRRS